MSSRSIPILEMRPDDPLEESSPPVESSVVDDLHARLARSFGSVATAYAQHRPTYPDQAVAWALESLTNDSQALDLAAGTGKLTEAILRCGVPATAVLAVLRNDEDDSVDWVVELTEVTRAAWPGVQRPRTVSIPLALAAHHRLAAGDRVDLCVGVDQLF